MLSKLIYVLVILFLVVGLLRPTTIKAATIIRLDETINFVYNKKINVLAELNNKSNSGSGTKLKNKPVKINLDNLAVSRVGTIEFKKENKKLFIPKLVSVKIYSGKKIIINKISFFK